MINLQDTIKTRNSQIYYLFEKVGWRQRKIAELHGLSEQRVKHIIGQVRKERMDKS